jgi:hypothetical protein
VTQRAPEAVVVPPQAAHREPRMTRPEAPRGQEESREQKAEKQR